MHTGERVNAGNDRDGGSMMRVNVPVTAAER